MLKHFSSVATEVIMGGVISSVVFALAAALLFALKILDWQRCEMIVVILGVVGGVYGGYLRHTRSPSLNAGDSKQTTNI